MNAMTMRDAIIYLRLSDFRDEDDETFIQREAELRAFARMLGLNVVRVAVENDVNGNGKSQAGQRIQDPGPGDHAGRAGHLPDPAARVSVRRAGPAAGRGRGAHRV